MQTPSDKKVHFYGPIDGNPMDSGICADDDSIDFYDGELTVLEKLRKTVVMPASPDEERFRLRVLQVPRTVLVYGQPGTRFDKLIYSLAYSNEVHTGVCTEVCHWKFRPWNVDKFIGWVDRIFYGDGASSRKLVVIQNIEVLKLVRDPKYLDKLVYLLTRLQQAQLFDKQHVPVVNPVRIVMTCADVPKLQDPDLLEKIDVHFYVPPPAAADRKRIMKSMITQFKGHWDAELKDRGVRWSIDVDVGAYEKDPDHIVNTLAMASQGATVGQIQKFIRSVNTLCSDPGPTPPEYNEHLFLAQLYEVNGAKSITGHDLRAAEKPFRDYLRIRDPDVELGATTPVVQQQPQPVGEAPNTWAEPPLTYRQDEADDEPLARGDPNNPLVKKINETRRVRKQRRQIEKNIAARKRVADEYRQTRAEKQQEKKKTKKARQ